MLSAFDEIRKNKRNSNILIISYMILIGILGIFVTWILSYNSEKVISQTGMVESFIIAVLIAGSYAWLMSKTGSKLILKMAGAKKVTKKEYPFLFHTVDGLSVAAGFKRAPNCYVIKDSALNAFATGSNPENSAIAVTTGLLEKMNRQELEGVIGHEMSHIKNYDTRYMLFIVLLIGIITFIGEIFIRMSFFSRSSNDREKGSSGLIFLLIGLAFMIVGPIIGQIIRFAVSRKREYLADAGAVELTRYPAGLKSALEKIKNDPDPLIEKANKTTANLFISNPFRKKRSILARIFSTHPPIEERISKLEQM